MRARCIDGQASVRRSRCTSCGICRTARRTRREVQALASKHGLRAGSINPNTFQDQIYKYRLARQSGRGSSARGAGAYTGERRDRAAAGQPGYFAVVRRRVELSGDAEYAASAALVRRRTEGARTSGWRQSSGMLRGVQTVRAGVLSHRHRGLGHGAGAGAIGGAAGQGTGGHGASLPGAEYRADRGVAAGSRTCSAGSTSTTAGMRTTT